MVPQKTVKYECERIVVDCGARLEQRGLRVASGILSITKEREQLSRY